MLDIKNLHLSFHDHDETTHVLRGLNLHMDAGERMALVGESGSGKSVTALAVAGLLQRRSAEISGQILFEGRDLLQYPRDELRKIQGRKIGMIFQEPMTSLNPLMKVGHQIEEVLSIHTDMSAAEKRALALEVMEQVDLPEPERTYGKYPHQLSGGQRQRAMIAAAFISNPKLLLADEPTTALDVTVQAQIIDLLRRLSEMRGLGILFISHDLHVVRKLCTHVAVIHKGVIVESGEIEQVFNHPQDDYTRRLIAAIPTREKRKR